MDKHHSKQLHRVDLNLLVAFDALLTEQNVTNAAKVMFVSQSAMSRSLKKLRDAFDDPLFIRTSTGLTPTAKAIEIGSELQHILPQLSDLFDKNAFEPQSCKETFSLSLPTYLGSTILPSLVLDIFLEAPDVNLIEMAAKSNPYDLLDKGKLDFAVHYSRPTDNKYKATPLGTIYPKIYVRKSHPLASKNATLEEILSYPIVAMNVEEDHKQTFNAPLQMLLSQQGAMQKPTLRSTQTQVLLDIAANSDMVVFGMNALSAAHNFSDGFVGIYDFIDDTQYHVELFLLQHQRNFNSLPHQWLAKKIQDYVAQHSQGADTLQ
ncbi:LysR family transcriptional regulator [Vibrio amylolyticus]|uniref:LysR family transcriptional regulator n=1 Tax=Vibrio amylolyticus TaxID=2847292 RepID=UPI003551B417